MIYYVNNSAPKNGNGTKEMPFKFINDAAKIAKAGDEVLVAPGIYHEYVDRSTEEPRMQESSIRVRSRSAQRSPVRKR